MELGFFDEVTDASTPSLKPAFPFVCFLCVRVRHLLDVPKICHLVFREINNSINLIAFRIK